jgi:hypothetical protein
MMQPKKRAPAGLAALILCAAFVSGCQMMDRNTVPPDGTSVTSTSEVFRRTASDLQEDCDRMGGCTCILDGFQTTCAVVFACLDAGFCERVATQ